jgi:phosphomethylpyrimidine synthase
MCGVDFCSMRIDQDARDADGDMADIENETALADSLAADVNRPPTGRNDGGDPVDRSDERAVDD